VTPSKLKAVVLDWAGTILDYGSFAPLVAFQKAFGAFGVTVTMAEARAPMGLAKRDHIQAVARGPRVADAWKLTLGRDFSDADADAILKVFEPINIDSVKDHSALVPGALATLADLRRRGLKIGSTTGYTRPIMAALAPLAEAQGYKPDMILCAGDLPAGRPSPLMMWRTMADLGVSPAASVVKVDDTAPGIGEGRAAGTWTVGVALSGNEVGLTPHEVAGLSEEAREGRRAHAGAILRAAGADYVIDTIVDLPAALDQIEARLARGETPHPAR
jgi:phosphonoacetaldehyde hydrolase